MPHATGDTVIVYVITVGRIVVCTEVVADRDFSELGRDSQHNGTTMKRPKPAYS